MEPDSNDQKESVIPPSSLLEDQTDDALLRHWKSGNEQAAEILNGRYTLRLVALVASRLNRRYKGTIDPEDVVQSAMGSFFDAARHSRINVSGSVSMWRLLATFARRKMVRSIEKQSARKRGGSHERVSFAAVELPWSHPSSGDRSGDGTELMEALQRELPDELWLVCERLLAGQQQIEIARALSIDERTVRRRVARIRETLAGSTVGNSDEPSTAFSSISLPRIDYRHFVLGKLIGSGGFGKLYRAIMQSDGSIVAVKFLRKIFWQNEDAKQTFLREIESASLIEHPGVVRYLGWGRSPHGGPYVVSRWVDGSPLHQLGSIKPDQFIYILRQICEALGAIHRAGLVHGDLTPSNVLIDRNDRVTIIDFGFSRRSVKTSDAIPNPLFGGTIGFAAPEQISPDFGTVSQKTDIYAIGGIIYWYLTGRPPHQGASFEEAIADTIATRDVDISELPDLPLILRKFLANTLRKSPSERELLEADVLKLRA